MVGLDKLLSKTPGTGSDEFDCLNSKFGVGGRFGSAGLNFSPHVLEPAHLDL